MLLCAPLVYFRSVTCLLTGYLIHIMLWTAPWHTQRLFVIASSSRCHDEHVCTPQGNDVKGSYMMLLISSIIAVYFHKLDELDVWLLSVDAISVHEYTVEITFLFMKRDRVMFPTTIAMMSGILFLILLLRCYFYYYYVISVNWTLTKCYFPGVGLRETNIK